MNYEATITSKKINAKYLYISKTKGSWEETHFAGHNNRWYYSKNGVHQTINGWTKKDLMRYLEELYDPCKGNTKIQLREITREELLLINFSAIGV